MGFESSYRRHLDQEQRRAVLEALGGSIHPDSTLGEVIDAAEALGFGEQMGELSLADLADALLRPEETDAGEGERQDVHAADEGEDEDDEDDDDEPEDDEPEQLELTSSRSGRGRKKAAASKPARATPGASKKSAKKAAAKPTASKKAAKKAAKPSVSKKTAKKAAAKPSVSKKSAKKVEVGRGASRRGRGKSPLTAAEVDERMSLDQAAEFFLPYIESIGEATMQALEEETAVARRKLRFHIGQLVRHGYLERHGMGRGTYYTIA